MTVRTGIGYDVHAFGGDGPLMVGCVEISDAQGVVAHSDGDVVAHAVCDALLGAAALGDIGKLFPPDDDKWRNAPGVELLEEVARRLGSSGFQIINIDATVLLETPKIGHLTEEMRARMAFAIGIDVGGISVKATTNEGLGFVGRREGVACIAVATVQNA